MFFFFPLVWTGASCPECTGPHTKPFQPTVCSGAGLCAISILSRFLLYEQELSSCTMPHEALSVHYLFRCWATNSCYVMWKWTGVVRVHDATQEAGVVLGNAAGQSYVRFCSLLFLFFCVTYRGISTTPCFACYRLFMYFLPRIGGRGPFRFSFVPACFFALQTCAGCQVVFLKVPFLSCIN